MNPGFKFVFILVCLCGCSEAVPVSSGKGIIYSTRRDKPPNIHYMVKIDDEKVEEKETIKLSCVNARKGDPGKAEAVKNETEEAVDKNCVKKSVIITAPSRPNAEEGRIACTGLRKKDIHGLCRKIWD